MHSTMQYLSCSLPISCTTACKSSRHVKKKTKKKNVQHTCTHTPPILLWHLESMLCTFSCLTTSMHANTQVNVTSTPVTLSNSVDSPTLPLYHYQLLCTALLLLSTKMHGPFGLITILIRNSHGGCRQESLTGSAQASITPHTLVDPQSAITLQHWSDLQSWFNPCRRKLLQSVSSDQSTQPISLRPTQAALGSFPKNMQKTNGA